MNLTGFSNQINNYLFGSKILVEDSILSEEPKIISEEISLESDYANSKRSEHNLTTESTVKV